MSIDESTNEIRMSPKEALGTMLLVLTIISALSLWIVIPHRVEALEKRDTDYEARIRSLEMVRVDLAEIKSDLREIKIKLRSVPATE